MSIVYAQKNLTDDTADAFESFVEILLSGLDTVSFQLAGTWTGTVTFESTTDGDTYASLSVTPSTGAAAVTTATANGIWAADGCAGFYAVRARCSTFGSGVIIASAGAGANSVQAIVDATDGQVLFMDGSQVSGDSGLLFDKTTNVQSFVSGGGLSFAGVASPIVMKGGDDGSGDTALIITQADSYVPIVVEGADLAIDTTGEFNDILITANGAGGGAAGQVTVAGASGGGDGYIALIGDLRLDNNNAIKTPVTDTLTLRIQAYDVDGAAYKTFVTLTNGNTPSCLISQPAGATLAFIPPTADPHVVGALWNNLGTLTISAG